MILLTHGFGREMPVKPFVVRGNPFWLIIIKERVIFWEPNIYLTL